MKTLHASLSACTLLSVMIAGAAFAAEGEFFEGIHPVPAHPVGLVTPDILQPSPFSDMKDLELASARKPTARDDRKFGDE
ncbi:hypothetical protein [Pseudorhizobium pelagicum]|uniref:Uncharacterized protein n=1 Tax=Pseudorhizobium pelagicum TaxID=1509405 RepID=A0A922P3I6_9HYPH|nr:hypothetical protein [Pseudorhizobium pelagicum]KEQ02570.1 hypothetical protein GV67_19145 [Pseudorhizobium pelagicum]KEQ10705.1 hypothetical protein GV68_10675 [Pseudorhizobium pelagicum]